MKRHESLHELSRHHHFALMEALYIRRAMNEPPEKRALRLRKVAEKFVEFWEKKGKLHFREEEEILLPAYSVHVPLENDQDVIRMLAGSCFDPRKDCCSESASIKRRTDRNAAIRA